MFNQFAKYEDAFRDWRRDGMPGLKAERGAPLKRDHQDD